MLRDSSNILNELVINLGYQIMFFHFSEIGVIISNVTFATYFTTLSVAGLYSAKYYDDR
jgi:hypothetical protein